VRFLLVNNHCITDPTAGVTQSFRTIMQWLANAGHPCQVLTTARFETPVSPPIEEHLSQFDVQRVDRDSPGHRPVVHYSTGGIPITMLLTEHNTEETVDLDEGRQYVDLVEQLLDEFVPDHVIGCNAHAMISAALMCAQERGISTSFGVRGFGYYQRESFEHVNHVFTCSRFLTDFYRDRIGLNSTPLEPPIDWSTVIAPSDARQFLTFVHPAPHKGLYLFARLADMLGARRPDIPILVVQSGRSAGLLNSIPGVDFSKYSHIVAAPPTPLPADYFALTRMLLVPSVWPEPFGRVAAEAMINGIPALVSDRGALPDVIRGDAPGVDGGYVLPIPEWMTEETMAMPTEREVEPWYQAVCTLWDDPVLYDEVSARGQRIAEKRYAEAVSSARHVDYFTRLSPGCSPFDANSSSEQTPAGGSRDWTGGT
jgi:glycosyltransferase involved in cell wall biosynthesis